MGIAPVRLRLLHSDGRDLQYIVHIQFGCDQYRQVISSMYSKQTE